MIILSKLSENLQELMDEQDLNQISLSEKVNVGRSTFSGILNAKTAPNYNTFIALLEYFNCSADFLIGFTDYPNEEINYKPVQPFKDRLRVVLKEYNKSQYRLVKDAKISWSVLYNWLIGKTLPSLDNLVKLAQYFNCSVDVLLGRV